MNRLVLLKKMIKVSDIWVKYERGERTTMKKKFMILYMGLILILLGCLGCDNSNASENSLAVVVSAHGNALTIPLNSPTLKSEIYNSCYTYGNVTFVSVDGDPKVYYQADIPNPEVSGLSENKKKTIANAYMEQLLYEINRVEALVPEVDTLKSIQRAAFALNGSSDEADKVMLVMDSGLSTKGYLNFTDGLLNVDDVNEIVNELKKAEAIPNLENISVIWMFNGQTAEPQPELSERQKKKLQEIWEAVLLAGGAESVKFTADMASETIDKEYPFVSLVEAEERVIQQDNIIMKEDVVILDSERVHFEGNKAVFVDKKEAKESIEKVAMDLIDYPEKEVYVIGTTATGREEFCKRLSEERAEAVVDLLIEYGVREEQLTVEGLGYQDDWHITDLDENGELIEEIAKKNRKVLIVDADKYEMKK